MNDKIFPIEEVGDFYNDKFINVKFQLDSTPNDADDIKARYADAAFIRTGYKVAAYPTYLFFSPEGEILHGSVGSRDINEFIALGTNALVPEKQYYNSLKKYETGQRDSAFLRGLTLMAASAGEEAAAAKFARDYCNTQTDLTSDNNLLFLYHVTQNVKDTGFGILIKEFNKLEAIINRDQLHDRFKFMIVSAEFTAVGNWETLEKWDIKQWDMFAAKLRRNYPPLANEVLLQFKTSYYRRKNNWIGFADAVNIYITSGPPRLGQLNECAWGVFSGCAEKKILTKALRWSKLSFIGQPKIEPGYIDTYANLLYKTGKKKEALYWEKKAQKIAIEQGANKYWGQEVIDKIKKNEKTWM